MSGSPSADRLGQALSGYSLRPPAEGAADSGPPPVLQAPTDVSAAGVVLENARLGGVHSVASEGVASAGLPPQAVGEAVGEFVPPAVEATHSLAAGFQGETSGLHDGGTAGGSTYGFGETVAAGPTPGTASAQVGAPAAAASHYASYVELAPATHQAKRKMSEMGEVGDQFSPGTGAAAAAAAGQGEEVQECDMRPAAPSGGSDGEAAVAGGFNRVPSDVAMVLGDLPAIDPGMLPDDCDSNFARAIQASLDDARAQQQQQQQQQQPQQPPAGGGGGESAAAPAAAAGEAVLDSTAVAAADPSRPSDAAIIAWENEIKEGVKANMPLMGDREPLDALAAEYAQGSPIYRQKIERLKQDYGSIRRTRGDGNCFFRSFLFGYLEGLLLSGEGLAERDRVLGRLEGMKPDLTTVGGYDEIVVETPLEMAGGMLRSLGAPLDPLTIEGLETSFRDDDICGYSIWMLRMVTSCEIKRRADFFAPFIMGLSDLDVATFCARCVDPMGEESDHVQLVALTDALQVPVRVVYLDRSLAPGGGAGGDGNGEVHVDMHDFIPEGCPAPAQPRVHLLYRPGHYDLLYPLAS